jgi:serine/threonine protein kinase/tetratricopeptide (TPR) repeat protein
MPNPSRDHLGEMSTENETLPHAPSPSAAETTTNAPGALPLVDDPDATKPPSANDPPVSVVAAVFGVAPPGYEILGELGRGGMGVVYKARQEKLKRTVALKMILSGGHAGANERERFLAEAEAIAAIQDPGIVQIHEFGTHEDLPFFALEYCAGGSLANKLNGAPLPPRESAQLVEQIARAMRAAHERGIIHRDLKPANVLLAPAGLAGTAADFIPKITDFGLARRVEGGSGLTQTGAIVGTPSYMAPEQAEGKKDIGPVADIYSLGAILYECLTGRPPFRAATVMDTLFDVVHREVVPPRQLNAVVPRDLETICLKCLEKDPPRRYSSALALAQDLERFSAGEPILARPEGTFRKLGRRLRQQRTPLLIGLVVVAALAAVLFFASGSRKNREIANLVADIQDRLNSSEWTPGHADTLDEQISRLEQLDPAKAAPLRSQVVERFKQAVLRDLARPRLEPADIAGIQASVDGIATRDEVSGKELRERLAQRLHTWQTVLDLSKPFADWTKTFSNKEAALLQGKLRSIQDAATGRIIYTKQPCPGNAQWEARFEDWESAPEVGIGLNFTRGHTSEASILAFSHNGRLLASGGADRQVLVWDVAAGLLAHTLREEGPIRGLAFSADDRRLYVAADTHLGVWDAGAGTRLKTLKVPDPVHAVAASRDGRVLATAGGPGIRLWNSDSLEPLAELKGHTRAVIRLAFADDSRLLVSASQDGTVRLWDRPGWKARAFVPTHPAAVHTMALSPNGATLAAQTATGILFLWDLVKQGKAWQGPAGGAGHGLAFSPDGRTLLFNNEVLDVARREHLHWLNCGAAAGTAWSGDGRTLAVIDWPRHRVRLFDAQTATERVMMSGTGYDLVLCPSSGLPPGLGRDGKAAKPPTFNEVRARDGDFWLQVRRNGVVQFEQAVRVPTGPLTLRATREGDRLSVQVNDLPPLVALDASPLPVQDAVGLLIWPRGVALTRLTARQQTEVRSPSLLEQAEALLLRGHFEEALRGLEKQALAHPDGAVGQEARYKAAMCLVKLNRPEEAAGRLETLSAEPGERWPLLSAFQLWTLRLAARQLQAADAIFDAVSNRYPAETLPRYLPIDLRLGILDHYPHVPGEEFNHDPGRVARLEQLNRLADYLGLERSQPDRWSGMRHRLVRAYWLEGREDRALEVTRKCTQTLVQQPSSPIRSIALSGLRDLLWLLRRNGEAQQTLDLLRRLEPPADSRHDADVGLRLGMFHMRAQAHWALGDLDSAEKAANEGMKACLARSAEFSLDQRAGIYGPFSLCAIMKGFIREKRGDRAGALAVWKASTFRAWQETSGDSDRSRWIDVSTGVLIDMAMCAWTGQGDAAEFARKFENYLRIFGRNAMIAEIARQFKFPPKALRDICNSPRGRDVLRKYVFQEQSLHDYLFHPMFLIGVAVVRSSAMPAMTVAEEDIVWKLCDDGFALYQAGKLPRSRMLQLALAWKGTSGFLGWGSVSSVLPPNVRGPTAYVLGFRFEKLGKKADARTFFQTARRLAPADSALAKLAQVQLDRLAKP